MNKQEEFDLATTIRIFIQEHLYKNYHIPLFSYLQKNSHLIKTFSGFLLNPSKLIVYFGKTHIAIEYMGLERIETLPNSFFPEVEIYDYSNDNINFFEEIIGFKYNSTSGISLPLIPGLNENYLLPTNKGFDKLHELQWNFSAQDFSMMAMNTSAPIILENHFSRIINGFFFDADDSGLKTRHIKWLDFIPILFDDSDGEVAKIGFDVSFMSKFIEHDAHYIYPLPSDNNFKFRQLPKINRFIEIWGNKNSSEPIMP